MRYADRPSLSVGLLVRAPASTLWGLITDIELAARFSPELQRVDWLHGTGPELGASFVGHNRHEALGEWRTVSHIVALEHERLIGWAVVDPDGRFGGRHPDPGRPLATWTFDIAAEDGGSRLTRSVRIGPARSGLSLAIDGSPGKEEEYVAHRLAQLRDGMQATLEGIKALAEEGTRG